MRIRSSVLKLEPPSENKSAESDHKNTVSMILDECDKMAAEGSLDDRQTMHLRLIAEEMITMLPHILEYGSGLFCVENDNGMFTLRLTFKVKKNRRFALPKEEKGSILTRICNAIDRTVNKMDNDEAADKWSLKTYSDTVRNSGRENNRDAWDELEQSLIVRLADNVVVMPRKNEIEIVMEKNFAR